MKVPGGGWKRSGSSRQTMSAPAEALTSATPTTTAPANPLPRQRSRSILTAHRYLMEFARRAAASVPHGARVLDAGAGDSPYRPFFAHTAYEAADVCKRDAH